MFKNLILIENNKKYQFATKEELTKHFLGNTYYQIPKSQQKELLILNSIAQCMNTEYKSILLEEITNNDLEDRFIVYDDTTYILSLLVSDKIVLLENKDANIFAKEIDTTKYRDNYIILNKFAKKMLSEYIESVVF